MEFSKIEMFIAYNLMVEEINYQALEADITFDQALKYKFDDKFRNLYSKLKKHHDDNVKDYQLNIDK